MRWLCLHFPWLALELHGLAHEQPRALLDGRQRIEQINPAAAQQGVRPGQALATALALCPELQLLATSEARLQAELTRLALWAGAFSARISLLPPRALLLEIASMLHYFGGVQALLAQVQAALEQTGYQARLALGSSALGAELLAAVTDWHEPDEARWRQRLEQLSLAQLQLPPAQQEQLHGAGLRHLGELWQLSEQARIELARRCGPGLLLHLDRIRGQQERLPPIFTPPQQFVQRIELAAEVVHSQGLLFPLRRLLQALEGFLQQRQQQACRLALRLSQREGEQCLQIGHAGGSAAAEHWLELCRLQFERTPLQAPVLALTLSCDELKAQQVISEDLFTPARPEATPERLLSRLQNRLGMEAVQTLGLQADHRPEQVLATGDARARDWQGAPRQRPGWLLAAPQPLSDPCRLGVTLLQGPERIEAGWWDRAPEVSDRAAALPERRDYFVARWPDGRCGWLYRDRRGRWFVHGWFG